MTAGQVSASPMSMEILSQLMLKLAGHPLSRDRQYRIDSALGPILRARGYDSIDSMVVALVSHRDDHFETEIVEALLNNETYFFRDQAAFDLIKSHIFKRLKKPNAPKRLSIWSAGVSTGQEAYSLAMMINDHGELFRDWHIEILGTDVSAHAVRRARAGLYSQFEVQRGLPALSLIKYFEKSGKDWQIAPSIRARVKFEQQDITQMLSRGAAHDIILCRNLLLYFPAETRRAVFAHLRSALVPDGVLMLGAAETILGQTDAFEADGGQRGLYRPRQH